MSSVDTESPGTTAASAQQRDPVKEEAIYGLRKPKALTAHLIEE